MKIISREDLKAKLDRGEDVKLIMALDRRAFENMHIPGSIHFTHMREAVDVLDAGDEIVVYCSNPHCAASIHAYHLLARLGFTNLARYAGGLAEWQEAGYPLVGLMAPKESV